MIYIYQVCVAAVFISVSSDLHQHPWLRLGCAAPFVPRAESPKKASVSCCPYALQYIMPLLHCASTELPAGYMI